MTVFYSNWVLLWFWWWFPLIYVGDKGSIYHYSSGINQYFLVLAPNKQGKMREPLRDEVCVSGSGLGFNGDANHKLGIQEYDIFHGMAPV